MYGGKITNNHATYSGSDINVKPSGGGVFLREYSKFEMYGGEITGNTATYGGGVYFKDKAFQVTGKGKVTITDNTGNGGKNVVLFDGKIIQVTGKLHEDTRIGVRSFHNPTDGNPITIAKATDGGWIQKGNFTFRHTGIAGSTSSVRTVQLLRNIVRQKTADCPKATVAV